MPRTFVSKLMIVGVALIVVGVSFVSFRLIAQASSSQRVGLDGQTVPLISHSTLLGAANGQQQLNLSVGLQLRNQQELENLLSNMYRPGSSLYHHFLTPQQFADEFGPTADQQQQVVAFLRSQGFTVSNVSSNGLLIDASATVAQAEAAFEVSINNYKLGARDLLCQRQRANYSIFAFFTHPLNRWSQQQYTVEAVVATAPGSTTWDARGTQSQRNAERFWPIRPAWSL